MDEFELKTREAINEALKEQKEENERQFKRDVKNCVENIGSYQRQKAEAIRMWDKKISDEKEKLKGLHLETVEVNI